MKPTGKPKKIGRLFPDKPPRCVICRTRSDDVTWQEMYDPKET